MTPPQGRPFLVMERDDDAARQRIRTSLDESLIVEAAAGTGKTYELVQRMVALLAAGKAKIEGVAGVTFTHKAAGELKLRLRQELDAARGQATDPQQRENLEQALAHLEEAVIGTIHSFCAQILRERPVEAVVDPAFEELNQTESERLFDKVFREWFERRLSQGSPVLRRALARVSYPGQERFGSPMSQLRFAGWTLTQWRDYTAKWRRDPFDRETEIGALLDSLRVLAAYPVVKDVLARAERARRLGIDELDDLEAHLVQIRSHRDIPYKLKELGGKAPGKPGKAMADLERFERLAGADLAAPLRDEFADLILAYEELKRRSGKLDFLDLLLKVRNLLRDNSTVRAELQQQFTHIFVDEFQDTDPLQMEILLLLAAADPRQADWREARPKDGKLFVVGDPKQSIYKFRRADLELYEETCRVLERHDVARIYLTRSRRSVPGIQAAVNTAFDPQIRAYVPLERHREAIADQPCVVVIPAPEPYGVRNITKGAIDKCLPDAMVAFIDWLIHESGWRVSNPERGDELVPIEARHICLLFRRFVNYGEDITRDYARSLEARGIPHMLIGSKSFHRREEVEAMRAALTAIEWPDDELAVFATLHGSLFAIDDATLLRYREQAKSYHPYAPRPESLDPSLALIPEALDLLRDLHRARNRRPIAATIMDLLEKTRAHAGFAFRPGGDQVLANVYRLCDMARNFERSGGLSFRAFVEELTAQFEKTDTGEPPLFEDSAAGVRLMTVHTAKGLEFPVVLLCDMTANLAARTPDRYIDADRKLCAVRILGCSPAELNENIAIEEEREKAEGIRVAYVAATRARDLLVVPAVGDSPRDGWLSPLNAAVFPEEHRIRHAAPAPNCPSFGDSSVKRRPPDYNNQPEFSVRPGLHRLSTHELVWWDPAALHLGAEEKFGEKQRRILSEKGDADTQLAALHQWQQQRQSTLERGSTPQCQPIATTGAGAPPDGDVGIELLHVDRETGRPTGSRFGTLVHALLHDVPLDAGPSTVASYAAVRARLSGATEAERNAAARAVTAALQHPLMQRARTAHEVRHEWPLVLPLDDGRILEGAIDLAFRDDAGWTVVDFKTDADLGAALPHYQDQLRWYVAAVARITNQSVRGVLLAV